MVSNPSVRFSLLIVGMVWALAACTSSPPRGLPAETLRTPEGLAEWQRGEGDLKKTIQAALAQYKQDDSLQSLEKCEGAVRDYLDHGFGLYRAYRGAHLTFPDNLIASLEQRTGLLMDVAEEYIKHGSLAIGEGIAADMVHNYSDLPTLAPAQRRAEAVLLRYRYRQDY
jgi:hypothetical protein